MRYSAMGISLLLGFSFFDYPLSFLYLVVVFAYFFYNSIWTRFLDRTLAILNMSFGKLYGLAVSHSLRFGTRNGQMISITQTLTHHLIGEHPNNPNFSNG